ncbi:MAG: PPC domain-containing protein [Polyangiales bacterium]
MLRRDAGSFVDAAPRQLPDAGPSDAGSAQALDADLEQLPSNDSFETARPITLGDQGGGAHTIDHAAQVNYYSFQAEAGHFYDIRTRYGSFSPDTEITLYDADHTRLAYNNNGSLWPGDDVDARLVVRAQASGTYYVEVRDLSTTPDMISPSSGGLSAFYSLIVVEIQRDTPGFGFDAEGADGQGQELAFSTDVASGYAYVTVVGSLSSGGRDQLPFAGRGGQALIGHVLKPGTDGNGSTEQSARFWIADGASHTLASLEQSAGQEQLHPPIDDGDYALSAQATSDPAGENDFYAVDLVILPENPGEQSDAKNGTIAGAEQLMMKQSPRFERGLLLARLPPLDVDYFEVDAFSGDMLGVLCEAASAGSGLVDLRAEVRDPDDKLVTSATESANALLAIDALQLSFGGAYYVRLSAGGQRPGIDGDWARCAVTVQR